VKASQGSLETAAVRVILRHLPFNRYSVLIQGRFQHPHVPLLHDLPKVLLRHEQHSGGPAPFPPSQETSRGRETLPRVLRIPHPQVHGLRGQLCMSIPLTTNHQDAPSPPEPCRPGRPFHACFFNDLAPHNRHDLSR
jgi:hypothetical protein